MTGSPSTPSTRRSIRAFWRRHTLASSIVLAIGVLIALTLVARALTSGGDATARHIRQSGVWRVGMDPSFPPFEILDAGTGKPVGLDVDLVNAIAAQWGVRAEIVGLGFDELIDAVAAHRVDSAVSALPVAPLRTREVSFSSPYFEAGVVLAVPRDSSLSGTDDLGGRRVAAEWGSEGDAQARALQQRLGGELTLILRESPGEALAAVAAGEADAVIVDSVSLALYDPAGESLRVVGAPLRSDPYVVMVPANAPQLLKDVDVALAALDQDGTLARLKARWLGANGR